jgi:hypothetical protein
MSGDDPTADLILMAKRFEKKCQNSRKLAKKLPYTIEIWRKFLCHWHPKAHPRVMSGELELKSPVLVVAPSQWRARFCPSSLEQK